MTLLRLSTGGAAQIARGHSHRGIADPLTLVVIDDTWVLESDIDVIANDSDKTVTVPADEEWRIDSIGVKFTSTITVGNRQIAIEIIDGAANVIFEARAGIIQTASLVRLYYFAPYMGDLTAFRDTDYLSNPFPQYEITTGWQIRVYDNNAVDPAADDMEVYIKYGMRALG